MRRRWRWGALLAVVALVVLAPVWLALIAFWAADGEWSFEGPGLRHWLLVKGSRLERLGLVAPTAAPVRYRIGLQDGNFPGWSIVGYASARSPMEIAEIYAQRCRSTGLAISQHRAAPERSEIVCEIEPYLDVEVIAERVGRAEEAAVTVRVWGSR